ncbi:MAG TPA: alpha/beta hydrolase [Actinomycetota bacterium]|nr:alpha/beta hydrolase [Actinomycetota bacterium]
MRRSRIRLRLVSAVSILLIGLSALPFWQVPAGAAGGIQVRSDIRYGAAPGQPLALDAYVPDGARNLPGVIIIHGGGWNSGKKEDAAWLAESLVQTGFVAFSIDYRLAPRYPFPAAINDVQAAIAFVRQHANDYGVDPTKLATIGGSAGGQLASLAAMWGKGPLDTGTRVMAAASISGPQDMAKLATEPNPRIQSAVWAFLGCSSASSCQQAGEKASPISYVDPSDPPIMITNSSEEFIPVDQATDMDAALTAAGVEHQLLIIPGDTHGLSQRRVAPVLDFLRVQLLGADAPSPSTTSPPTLPPSSIPPTRPVDRGDGDPRRPESSQALAVVPILAIAAVAFAVGLVAATALGRRRRATAGPHAPSTPEPHSGPEPPSAEGS